MNTRGHNERSFRLDALAADAREGLAKVEKGEEETIAGWLAYGHALNEGRALFPADRQFGEWVQSANLAEWNGSPVHDHDRAAAMWAAANADQFEEARGAGKARTIRGIHAKWKEIEAEREAQRKAEENKVGSSQDDEPSPVCKPADTLAADKAGISVADAADGPAQDDEPHEPVHAEKLDEPKPEPDHPNLRKEFQAMTDEAREDDWVGLRLEVADLRKRVAAQRSELADKNAAIKSLSAGSDMGAKLSAKIKEVQALKLARDEAMTKAKRMEYRMNKALERVKELESVGIEI